MRRMVFVLVPTLLASLLVWAFVFHGMSDQDKRAGQAQSEAAEYPPESERPDPSWAERDDLARELSLEKTEVGPLPLDEAQKHRRAAHAMLEDGVSVYEMFERIRNLDHDPAPYVQALIDYANYRCLIQDALLGTYRTDEPLESLEYAQSVFNDSRRSWALKRLQDLCADLESFQMELWTLEAKHSAFDVNAIRSIQNDINRGNHQQALRSVFDMLNHADDMVTISSLAISLADIHYQAMHQGEAIGLIDHQAMDIDDARVVANHAATLVFCERNGGCGMDNPITLSHCVMFGCDQSINDLNDLFEWVHSAREIDVMNQYLRLIRSAYGP